MVTAAAIIIRHVPVEVREAVPVEVQETLPVVSRFAYHQGENQRGVANLGNTKH